MTEQTCTCRFFLRFAVFFCFVAGCGGKVSAPVVPDGSKITLFLHTDAGMKETMKEELKADQSRLAAWMTDDLNRLFHEGGYLTARIQAPGDFAPEHRSYLVVVTIDAYNSENLYTHKDERLGEGVTNIRGTVELFKDNHTLPISRYTESVVSSRDWTSGAGELTKKMAISVSERLAELY